ncbi:hypothetical protein IWW38_000666 [Coemansia aciculifera]|uniref:Uncharacterized protein n=1 Tax=Coemansia aciculifera TaxID=417176 RepID=A0ACC1MAE1_9FUNG|nr:hypothetical protein IWW38_000666 [Coemansia aciculifera]
MPLNSKQVVQGLALAYEASDFAARNKRVQARALRVLKFTVVGMLVANLLIHVLVFFPLLILRLANYLVTTMFFSYDEAGQNALALLRTRDAVNHFMSTLPLLGLDILVHVKPTLFDDVFFGMLEEVDPEYARVLSKWPKRKFRWARLMFTAKRLAQRYAMTLVASYLSKLPFVGWLVVPVGALGLMAKFVGYPTAIALIAVSAAAPGTKRSTMFLFKSLLAMKDFSRDLLKPYFSHVGAEPKQQVEFYKAYESLLIGFILAFYFFVQLSWVGPAFYVLAQAAVALFIAKFTVKPPVYKSGIQWSLVTGPFEVGFKFNNTKHVVRIDPSELNTTLANFDDEVYQNARNEAMHTMGINKPVFYLKIDNDEDTLEVDKDSSFRRLWKTAHANNVITRGKAAPQIVLHVIDLSMKYHVLGGRRWDL